MAASVSRSVWSATGLPTAVDLTIRPERGWFHRFDEVLTDEPDVREEAIHQMNLLNDGSVVVLAE